MPETPAEQAARFIPAKRYLGDGVYAAASGWGTTLDLTSEDGVRVHHRIVLEPEVWRALVRYEADLQVGLSALMDARAATVKEAPPNA